jgi:hypothetical protein
MRNSDFADVIVGITGHRKSDAGMQFWQREPSGPALSPTEGSALKLYFVIPNGPQRLLKNSGKQIPRGLKPARDDKKQRA